MATKRERGGAWYKGNNTPRLLPQSNNRYSYSEAVRFPGPCGRGAITQYGQMWGGGGPGLKGITGQGDYLQVGRNYKSGK